MPSSPGTSQAARGDGAGRFRAGDLPVHTTLDGDTVFAAATGVQPLNDAVIELTEIGATAANVLARAIARGVV